MLFVSFKPIKKVKEQWPSPRFMCQLVAKFTPPSLPLLSFQMRSSVQFSSVAQSCPTLCYPHESQHARPPCSPPTPQRPSSQWCHPAISSSVVPFSSCPQSLPASECFPMSQLFTWGGQSTGASASLQWLFRTDFLQDWLVWSPCSPRSSQESSPTPQFKSINSLVLSFMVKISHPYMPTGKTIALTRWTFVSNVSAF